MSICNYHIYIKLNMNSYFPTLFHCHVDHCTLSVYLPTNSCFNGQKSGSHHQLFIYLTIHFQYTFITISEYLTCIAGRTNFSK